MTAYWVAETVKLKKKSHSTFLFLSCSKQTSKQNMQTDKQLNKQKENKRKQVNMIQWVGRAFDMKSNTETMTVSTINLVPVLDMASHLLAITLWISVQNQINGYVKKNTWQTKTKTEQNDWTKIQKTIYDELDTEYDL